MRLCLVGRPIVKPLYVFELLIESLNQAALDGRVLPLELRWRVIDLPLPCDRWFIITKPYLEFLLFEAPDELPLERASPMPFTDMVHSCSIHWKWWHCSTAPLCTIPCVLWLHRIISINTQVHFSLDQEYRYPIPLECILDNLIATACFCCSLLGVYAFESGIAWV
jgi:hypothetical protein